MKDPVNDNIETSSNGARASAFSVTAWHLGEIAAVFALFVLSDHLRLLPFALADIEPNPLWVPVALAAALHGRAVGIAAALVASVVEFWWSEANFADFPDMYAYVGAHAKEPLLWLIAAAVLGRIREQVTDRLRDVEDENWHKQTEARLLARKCESLSSDITVLEHRIATSGASTAGIALRSIEHLLSAPSERVQDTLADTLDRLIGAEGVDFYLRTEDGWHQVSDPLTNGAESGFLSVDAGDLAVCNNVASAGRLLSVARVADRDLLCGRAAMAAPTLAFNGTVSGVVFVRHVDPSCLTLAGEAALSIGCYALGQIADETVQRVSAPGWKSEAGTEDMSGKPRLRIINGNVEGT